MNIQLNTDKNLTIHQEYEEKIKNQINESLGIFDDLISRLEVHLSDENGSKEGIDDKRCLLEARLSGREPFAVSSLGNSYDLALHGAISKLKSKLETISGKLKAH